MNGEEFAEELYREHLYFLYEDKCNELSKELENLKKIEKEHQRINGKLKEENKQLKNQLQQKENIIKEVRDILKRYICNPSGLKDGWHIDCWNSEDISKLNEDLGILDKENKHDD